MQRQWIMTTKVKRKENDMKAKKTNKQKKIRFENISHYFVLFTNKIAPVTLANLEGLINLKEGMIDIGLCIMRPAINLVGKPLVQVEPLHVCGCPPRCLVIVRMILSTKYCNANFCMNIKTQHNML